MQPIPECIRSEQLFTENYAKLMLCRPLLVDNLLGSIPYYHMMTPLTSILPMIANKKIESVEYRDIKKILDNETICPKDKDYIKKQRKLANNRRAAKKFRERAMQDDSSDYFNLKDLVSEKIKLANEKRQLEAEIEKYKKLLPSCEAEF